MYQISRLQKGANTLSQDDRIDALQMACYYWILQLSKDQDMSVKTRKEELFNQELDQFFGRPNKDNTWIKI